MKIKSGDSIGRRGREVGAGSLLTRLQTLPHPPTPDPEAQAPSPFEAEIMEVKQRTFLFHTRQTQCLKYHGTDPAEHH